MKNPTLLSLAVLCLFSCKKNEDPLPGNTTKTTADFRDKYKGVFNIHQSGSTTYNPQGAPSYTTYNSNSGTLTISYAATDSVTVYWNPSTPIKMPAMSFVFGTGTTSILYAVDTAGRFYRNSSPTGGDSGGFVGTDSIYQINYNTTGHSSSVDTMLGHR